MLRHLCACFRIIILYFRIKHTAGISLLIGMKLNKHLSLAPLTDIGLHYTFVYTQNLFIFMCVRQQQQHHYISSVIFLLLLRVFSVLIWLRRCKYSKQQTNMQQSDRSLDVCINLPLTTVTATGIVVWFIFELMPLLVLKLMWVFGCKSRLPMHVARFET